MNAKKSKFVLIILLFLFSNNLVFSQGEGKKLFKQNCASCHKIGGGKLIGPDLSNVTKRRDKQWLYQFIKSSQSMVQSSDPLADSLFQAFNKLVMPDQQLSNNQIDAVLTYIESQSTSGGQTATTSTQTPPSNLTQIDIQLGRELFTGNKDFKNGGPACISCHNVSDGYSISGGLLARDLTQVYTRLGKQGITQMIKNPAFPAMAQTYQNKPITQKEIDALLAYFYNSRNFNAAASPGINYTFILYGVFGLIILWLIFSLRWFGAKKRSVNYSVINRQS